MELLWLGTAGFEIKTDRDIFYLDPYLSRNRDARPVQPKTAADIKPDTPIFISHAHFDHLMDIPEIAPLSRSHIYCSATAGDHLIQKKIHNDQIHIIDRDQQQFDFDSFSAFALFSRHVVFDLKLVISTLLKINTGLFYCLPYFRRFPCGQVLGWRFNLEDKSILFYGSAGATDKELEQAAKEPVDILLLPMQGHSDICNIGLKFVSILKPAIVVPHHHGNFFPPISRQVDIEPFLNGIKDACGHTTVIVPEMNTPISI